MFVPTAVAAENIGLYAPTVYNNSLVVTWSQISNAQSWNYESKLPESWNYNYYIERSKSANGGYEYIGKTSQPTFKDDSKDLIPGKTYYYRIAFMKNNIVQYSNTLAVTLKTASVTGLSKTSVDNSKAYIKWNELVNAVRWNYETKLPESWNYYYYIERSKSKTKGFKKIGSTDKVNFVDDSGDLIPGKTYYYRITGMVNKTTVKSSTITVKIKPIKFKNVRIAKANKKRVVIKWSQISNARSWDIKTKTSGRSYGNYVYYVQRSQKVKGGFKTIGGTDGKSYTDESKFAKGKTYYYRIAVMVNNTIKYSSAVKAKPRS